MDPIDGMTIRNIRQEKGGGESKSMSGLMVRSYESWGNIYS
jgi:hypothetical protein